MELVRIIHFVTDEKFINSAYLLFNSIFPERNTFYIVVNNKKDKLKYVKLSNDFLILENNFNELKRIAKSIDQKELVVFHGFDYVKSYILKNLSSKCIKIWMVWGGEVYNNSIVNKNTELFDNFTFNKFIAKRKMLIYNFIHEKLKSVYYILKYNTKIPEKSIIEALRRVDYCGVFFEEEFNHINSLLNANLKFLKFTYYPIELMLDNINTEVNNINILLGNSASATNNHIEAFKYLEPFSLENRKIIIPLNYGNTSYATEIENEGKVIFKENLIVLKDFLPLHIYNNYIKQCGIVIMNHYRQQAVGNIFTLLWMGAKVYLNEKNPLYKYLRNIGIIVFSIQKDLILENTKVFDLLNKEEQAINRKILQAELSIDFISNVLKSQLNKIIDAH